MEFAIAAVIQGLDMKDEQDFGITYGDVCLEQPWNLGKKYDSNFIFTFAVVKVRYSGITATKIVKHANYLK